MSSGWDVPRPLPPSGKADSVILSCLTISVDLWPRGQGLEYYIYIPRLRESFFSSSDLEKENVIDEPLIMS